VPRELYFIVHYLDNFVKHKYLTFGQFFSENKCMRIEGMTISDLAKEAGVSYDTAHKRLERAGIKPIIKEAIYPMSALEVVKNAPGRGRPPKAKPGK
jgi:hypothetical protein